MPRSLFSTDTDLIAESLLCLPAEFGCSVQVYDVQIIRRQVAALKQFDVVRSARKACPSIHTLRLMREQGVKVDSVSLGEIEHTLATGYNPQTHSDDTVFMTDIVDQTTLERVSELQIPVDMGFVDMLDQLDQVSLRYRAWLRVNPGFGHGHSQKTDTDGENSRHGIWYTDPLTALDMIQHRHLQLVGTHMHIGSGTDYAHLEQVCGAMVRRVLEFGQNLQAIPAGSGLSIPYQQGGGAADTGYYYSLWNAAREQTAHHLGHPVKLEIEPDRFLVAQADVLIIQVRSVKRMGSCHFVLVNAGFNDLMRSAIYDGYRYISALAADGRSLEHAPAVEAVATRPLCESGDIFIQQEEGNVETRILPEVEAGDYLTLHDTGVYDTSMSFDYSSRPPLLEILFDSSQAQSICRRQTIEELLASGLL